MKTQISILVKNDTIYSRLMTVLWFVNIFRKMSVNVQIDDGEVQKLKASKEPYVFDVEPGVHTITFTDPKSGSKAMTRAMTGAILGAAAGGAGGGSMFAGAAVGAEMAKGNQIREGAAQVTLNEGDVFELWCRNTRKGGVKVKQVKK